MANPVAGIAPNQIFYVNKVPLSGWLLVGLRSGDKIPILEYTKVKILETKGGMTWFVIQDGGYSGMTARLSEANAKEYLGKKAPFQTGVNIMVQRQKIEEIYSASKQKVIIHETAMLRVNALQMKITLNSIVKNSDREQEAHTPLPPGQYRVRLPDAPHDKNATSFYRDREEPGLRNDQVWFPIEYGDNSRYIHVGHLSHGCVTVIQLEKWNALYQALIEHRMSGTPYVGQIHISKSVQP
jgi:hypothetical protein